MFCGPYPEELSWRKKKQRSVDLTIGLGPPSSLFASILRPSVWLAYSGLSLGFSFSKSRYHTSLFYVEHLSLGALLNAKE